MHPSAPVAPRHDGSSWVGFLTHALIWMTLVGAGLLLAWFVAVLHDSVERGEQRRAQQRSSMASPLEMPLFSHSKTSSEVR